MYAKFYKEDGEWLVQASIHAKVGDQVDVLKANGTVKRVELVRKYSDDLLCTLWLFDDLEPPDQPYFEYEDYWDWKD